ncbi:MAG: hypothetical protein ACJ780_15425 [Solirubrobacteraceae bacterium]
MVERVGVGDDRSGGLPPSRKLTPQVERRLAIVSLALVAVGLISVVRLLVTGTRPARS